MKRGIGLAVGLLAGLMMIGLVLAWRDAQRLRGENEALRAALEQHRILQAQGGAGGGFDFDGGTDLTPDEKMELMRLRQEVTQLRASAEAARDAVKDALENRDVKMKQVAAVDQNGREVGGTEFPREQWSFRGYGTPEDAVVTAFWALANGDLEKVAESMTPEERTEWEQQRQGKNESAVREGISQGFVDVTGIAITGERQVSPRQLLMDLEIRKPQQKSRRQVHVYLVGNEWKMQSLVNNYDPLAFYRQNPELMKRYFPHLFREGAQQQPAQQLPQGQPTQTTMPPELMRRYGLPVQQQPTPPAEQAAVQGQGTLPPEPSPDE